MNNTNAKLKLTLDEARVERGFQCGGYYPCILVLSDRHKHRFRGERWTLLLYMAEIYSKTHKSLRLLGDWTNTLIQGIFRYFHKYSSSFCVWCVVFWFPFICTRCSNPNNERYDSITHENIIHHHEFHANVRSHHPMESFQQLNIHNQIVIKFGLFKIQAIKIIKTKHYRK